MNAVNALSRPTRIPSVVLKAIMAFSGFLMAGWLTLHMLGNLAIFAGPEVLNDYALKLRAIGVLWPMRIVLVVLLVGHILAALETSRRSRAARPEHYRIAPRAGRSTFASRTMGRGGVLLLAYTVYHVAHIYGVGHSDFIPGDVYHNLVVVLSNPIHASIYVLLSGVLAFHLTHGLFSSLRSMGLLVRMGETFWLKAMRAWALIITLGFLAPTVAIFFGWV